MVLIKKGKTMQEKTAIRLLRYLEHAEFAIEVAKMLILGQKTGKKPRKTGKNRVFSPKKQKKPKTLLTPEADRVDW